eukprot:GHVN01037675.1.p1 GENE.GHVN01037675.1~~GHVN01037675.1.p1  ORF type:complete len:721 (+),score=165.61 GHVN01037675.1:70-2232(+)
MALPQASDGMDKPKAKKRVLSQLTDAKPQTNSIKSQKSTVVDSRLCDVLPPSRSSIDCSQWWVTEGWTLGGGLIQVGQQQRCAGWVPSTSLESSPSSSNYEQHTSGSCRQCGLSPLYHTLLPNPHLSQLDTIPVLTLMMIKSRSVRSLTASTFMTNRTDGTSKTDSRADTEIPDKTDKKEAACKATKPSALCCAEGAQQSNDGMLKYLTRIRQQVERGEVTILLSKVSKLTTAVSNWVKAERQAAQRRVGDSHPLSTLSCFTERVCVIIAADALYYRLYYVQLTITPHSSESPNFTHCRHSFQRLKGMENDRLSLKATIPHPHIYFGSPHLTWATDAGEKAWHQLHQTSEGNDSEGVEAQRVSNPLFELHRLRMKETSLIFFMSGWFDSPHVITGHLKSALSRQRRLSLSKAKSDEIIEIMNEAPCKHPLGDWRDSCRDLLCSLYSYAVLTPEMIKKLKDHLTLGDAGGVRPSVAEMGAGTGYMASLLNRHGIRVTAWDIAPTSSPASSDVGGKRQQPASNEYHGNTPPFTLVNKGGWVSTSVAVRPYGQITSLMLSYPPPGDVMAVECVKSHLSAGGRCVIHVGEFRGLTGSSEVEALLVGRCECVERMRCPSWGNDCAELTVWMRRDRESSNQSGRPRSVLVPCSHCGGEAKKRCVFIRSIVYCSCECFDTHKDTRVRELMRLMIELPDGGAENVLSFENENHFVDLENLKTFAFGKP